LKSKTEKQSQAVKMILLWTEEPLESLSKFESRLSLRPVAATMRTR